MTNIVFGVGICMQNNWKLIRKYFKPRYFSDNGEHIWGTFPMGDGILCISPEKIRTLGDPCVLIAVGDPYVIQEIRKQMTDMGVECKVLVDCLGLWGEHEKLPVHLEAVEQESRQKRIFLFNSPEHDNVGDHLISIAELRFLEKYFPECEVIEITDIEYLWFHKRIRKSVRKEDVILITGGGFLGSLWLYNGEMNVREILREYPENPVIIMPQTIFFEENQRGRAELQKTVEIYGSHKNLTICLREKQSFIQMERLLGEQVHLMLVPDMALSMNLCSENEEGSGILLCLRRDKECVLDNRDKSGMTHILDGMGIGYQYTLMHTGHCFSIPARSGEIAGKAEQFQAAKLVVTDTLHGMILCAITGTPCLAFDNLSHKVSGVYTWIENLPYIHLCRPGEDLGQEIRKLLMYGRGTYDQSMFSGYYDQLAEKIREKTGYERRTEIKTIH